MTVSNRALDKHNIVQWRQNGTNFDYAMSRDDYECSKNYYSTQYDIDIDMQIVKVNENYEFSRQIIWQAQIKS